MNRTLMRLFLLACMSLCTCGASKVVPAPAPAPEPDMLVCEEFEDRLQSVSVESVVDDLQLTVRVYEGELNAADAERVASIVEAFAAKGLSICQDACKWGSEVGDEAGSKCRPTVNCLEKALLQFKNRVKEFREGEIHSFDTVLIDLDSC